MNLWIAVLALFLSGPSVWAQGNLRLKVCGKGPCPLRRFTGLATIPPHQHLILQFRNYPGPAIRAELAGRGIRILGYVPDSGLMVSAGRATDLKGLEVTWAGPLEAADKISPALAKGVVRAYLARISHR